MATKPRSATWLLWLTVGVAAVVLLFVIMAQVNSENLAAGSYWWAYSSPLSSPIESPVSEYCSCECWDNDDTLGNYKQFCPVWENGECKNDDWYYDFTSVTNESDCEAKEGNSCSGWDVHGTRGRGKLESCELVAGSN